MDLADDVVAREPVVVEDLEHESLGLQLLVRHRKLEVLVEQRVGVVPVDGRLPFPVVDLGDEREADVGVVEATLVASGEIMR